MRLTDRGVVAVLALAALAVLALAVLPIHALWYGF